MTSINRDENRVTALFGVSKIDFTSPTSIAVNPDTHAMQGETSLIPIPNLLSVGSITATIANVNINIPSGSASVGIQISGTWSGTLAFQGTTDGATWVALNSINGTSSVTSTTSNGLFVFGSAGLLTIRVSSTAWASGTASISMNSSTGAPAVTSPSLSLGANQSVNVAQVAGTNTVTGGVAGTLGVGGNVATNVAIGTNPINLGAQGVSSENAVVTTSRMVQLVADLVGKLIVLPYANPENFVNGTTAAITDTTTTSIIAAQAAGVRTYITSVIVTNSHATVGTFVKITDGAATILWEGFAASAGGGFTQSFPVALRGSTATAVNAICVTTGANVIVSAAGYKGV